MKLPLCFGHQRCPFIVDTLISFSGQHILLRNVFSSEIINFDYCLNNNNFKFAVSFSSFSYNRIKLVLLITKHHLWIKKDHNFG